ncbi:tubulin-specific chaperone C-like [Mya arenaria]|uniref:tubulin-specific chaperone C-like n=1 Tax=Mya arenaria TaxID=6604 RepID=UPI0022E2D1CD|nr:tubulin-specific chaperone C-like [Mya arenaria]
MAGVGVTSTVAKQNSNILEEKKQIVADRLKKRDDERLAEVEKQKEQKSETASAQESAKFFHEKFDSGKNDLEEEISNSDSVDKNKLADHFDNLSVMFQKLQRFLTESSMFLPSYDLRKSQDLLTKLQTLIQEKRDVLLPKKKFAFKAKKKGTQPDKVSEPKVVDTSAFDAVKLAECKLTDQEGKHLSMDKAINQKDVALANLRSCTVKLNGAASAVHINKLENCTILCGPVSGSIFIRECVNCVFVVACQQLRIHSTTDSQFYIHVTSRAIIEDCSSVRFGPYNWSYPCIDEHYNISGLDRNRNSWDDIDDFNWLAADKHSPNWSLIPENERKEQWDIQKD